MNEMIQIIESNRLIELVVDKHKRLLESFNCEFLELDTRLKSIRQQFDAVKKEIGTTEARILVLNEKHYLLFHQARKQREELFSQVINRMREKSINVQDVIRTGNSIGEREKKLQTSNNIDDEERMIMEIEKLLHDFESAAMKAGIIVTSRSILEKLNEACSSHKELLSLESKPKQQVESTRDYEVQINELEGRKSWLIHRIESHNGALAYWEKQRGGIKN